MPLGPGVRYRVKTTSGGKKVRLAFKGSKVIEAKNMKSGATHSPAEFAADKAKSKGKRRGRK
jgi:hypothetical protein